MKSKYLGRMSIEEWFRLPRKLTNNSSIVWKAMVEAFPLVGRWMVRGLEMVKKSGLGKTLGPEQALTSNSLRSFSFIYMTKKSSPSGMPGS
jgi:hypothetical protein